MTNQSFTIRHVPEPDFDPRYPSGSHMTAEQLMTWHSQWLNPRSAGSILYDVTISDQQCRQINLAQGIMRACAWYNTNLMEANLSNGDFPNTVFVNCTLDKMNTRGSNFTEAHLKDCSAIGSFWNATRMGSALWEHVLARGSSFTQSYLSVTRFKDCVLSGSNFSGADLSMAMFFEGSAANCRFIESDCSDTIFETDLSNADFTRANLSHADLSESDITMMIVKGAKLQGTEFKNRPQFEKLYLAPIQKAVMNVFSYVPTDLLSAYQQKLQDGEIGEQDDVYTAFDLHPDYVDEDIDTTRAFLDSVIPGMNLSNSPLVWTIDTWLTRALGERAAQGK